MAKPIRIVSAIAVSAIFFAANPASAQTGTPAYPTTFYSDPAHQTPVGSLAWVGCDQYDYPIYHLVGTYTYYAETGDEPIGYCLDGQMQPL
jgi:hypothetical protein